MPLPRRCEAVIGAQHYPPFKVLICPEFAHDGVPFCKGHVHRLTGRTAECDMCGRVCRVDDLAEHEATGWLVCDNPACEWAADQGAAGWDAAPQDYAAVVR